MKILLLIIALIVIGAVLFRLNKSSNSNQNKSAANEPSIHQSVGGIESLMIDNTFYYFGFDYRSDSVISPLFDNLDAIAEYAASHMLQTNGAQNQTFWRQMAEESQNESSLASDIQDRTFDRSLFFEALQATRQTAHNNQAVPQLKLNDHLQYLLEAACDWPDDLNIPTHIRVAANKFELDEDDLSPWFAEAMNYLNQSQSLPPSANYSDAALVFLWYFDTFYVNNLHSNWEQVLFNTKAQ